MEISLIIPHIEALIFASDKPLVAVEITELVNNALGFIDDRATQQQVEAAITGIKEKYDSEFYAFELKQSGGGWQFLTKPAYHKTVALINGDKFIKRLSVAALETLSIIAYKQPITKSEIESIRGVNCDYAVQKLLEKDLVIISGRNEDAVGKPLIYGTSKSFMDYFGINSADELPKISEVMMDEYMKATAVSDMQDVPAAHAEESSSETPLQPTVTPVIPIPDDPHIVIENDIPIYYEDADEGALATQADIDSEYGDEGTVYKAGEKAEGNEASNDTEENDIDETNKQESKDTQDDA